MISPLAFEMFSASPALILGPSRTVMDGSKNIRRPREESQKNSAETFPVWDFTLLYIYIGYPLVN